MASAKADYDKADEYDEDEDEDEDDEDDEDDDDDEEEDEDDEDFEDEDGEFDEDDDEEEFEDEEVPKNSSSPQRAGQRSEAKRGPQGLPQAQKGTSGGMHDREMPGREPKRGLQAPPRAQKGTSGGMHDREMPGSESKRGLQALPQPPKGTSGGMSDREIPGMKSNRGLQGLPQTQKEMPGGIHDRRMPGGGPSNVSGNDQYVQIAPLPIFKGEEGECPASHIAKFLRICRANNAATPEMWVRLFPVSLEGEAALWYEFNVDGKQLMWEEIKTFFIQTFRRSENVDQFRVELGSLRIGPKERVSAFFLRMQCILRRWPNNDLPDSFLKGSFVDGLEEDCQDWIILRNPPDLRAAVSLALQWEEAQNFKARRKSSDSGKQIESDGSSCNERNPTAVAATKHEAEHFRGMCKETGHCSLPMWCSGCRFQGHEECQWPHCPVQKIKAEACRCCGEHGKPLVCQQKQTLASKCGFCEGAHHESTCEVRNLMKELWKNSARKMNLLAGYRPFTRDHEIPSTVQHSQKSQCGCGSGAGDQEIPFSVKSIHNPLYQCNSLNCTQEMPCMNIERSPIHCCCRCWGQHLNSEPELQNHSCRCACISCSPKIGTPQEHCCCMCLIHNLNYKFPVQRM